MAFARMTSETAMSNALGGVRMSIRAPCLGVSSDAFVETTEACYHICPFVARGYLAGPLPQCQNLVTRHALADDW